MIEVMFGLVFVALYHFILSGQETLLLSFFWLVYYTLLFGTLGIIALYDRAHTYIPVSFLYFYGLLTVAMLFLRFNADPSALILLGPVIVALPFLIIWLVTRGKGLGFGDVLLFLGVGAFFGVSQGMAVLLLSIWLGALYGLYVKYISPWIAHRKKNGKVKIESGIAIPFVPFIVIAFILVLFLDIDITDISSVFAEYNPMEKGGAVVHDYIGK